MAALIPDAIWQLVLDRVVGDERTRLACSCVNRTWRRLVALQPKPLVVSLKPPSRGGRSGTFTSIQAAVNAAQKGQYIVVGPGRYEEEVVIEDKSVCIIASKSAQLVGGLQARRSARKTPRIAAQSGQRSALTIRGPGSVVVIHGLELRFRGRQSPCCVSISGGSNARLIGCRVSGVFDGISVSGEGTYAAVIDSAINECLAGIHFAPGANGAVVGCEIYGGMKASDGVVVGWMTAVQIQNTRFRELDAAVAGCVSGWGEGNVLERVLNLRDLN